MPRDNRPLSAGISTELISVRPYSGEDRSACAGIFEIVQREIFPNDDPAKFTRDRFQADTRGEELWVALADEQVIGFVTLWRPDPFIHYLLVDRQWRGQGIGVMLLDVLMASIDQYVDLKCRSDNKAARRFYQRNDWCEAGSGFQDGVTYVRYRKMP